MTWLRNDTWDYDDDMANRLLPKIKKFSQAIDILPVVKRLVSWRRSDLAHNLLYALPEVTRYQILHLSPGILDGTAVVTIGRRKGNRENMGQYRDGARPNDVSASIYLPSLKTFLRGEVGHVYTGILACTNAFEMQTGVNHDTNNAIMGARDKEMIFLAANNAPSAAEQEQNSISEPYLNREFSKEIITGRTGKNRTMEGSSGYMSYNNTTNKMLKNDHAIVHGYKNDGSTDPNNDQLREGGYQSHKQLQQMIVQSNRYRGVIRDLNNGGGRLIGFTVMKGGKDPYDTILNNVYGWTSSSMNSAAFKNPTGTYGQGLTAKKGELIDKINRPNISDTEREKLEKQLSSVRTRRHAQASEDFANKIKAAFDRLLLLQLNDNSNDPYFKSIISEWGSGNI